MLQLLLKSIGFYLLTPERQQWPDDMALDRQDAMESREPSTTKQIDEECFCSIVAMMGGENGSIILLGTDLLEVFVA